MFVIPPPPPHFPWNSYSVKSAVAPYLYLKDNCLCDKTEKKRSIHVNPQTYMQVNTPHRGTRGVDGPPPPLEFLICCSISKRFYLQRKAFDLLYKMRYILWVVALLGGLWRHQQWSPSWAPSWILPKIGNQVKTARNGDFFMLEMKNNT